MLHDEQLDTITRNVTVGWTAFMTLADPPESVDERVQAGVAKLPDALSRGTKEEYARVQRMRYADEQQTLAGLKATEVGAILNESTRILAEAEAIARQAPSAEEAYAAATEGHGLPPALALSIDAYELQFEALLTNMKPSRALLFYDEAKKKPDDVRHAARVRVLETCRDGWRGEPFDPRDLSEVGALRDLQQAIRQAQEARIPPKLTETIRLVEETQRRLRRIMQVKRLQFLRPEQVNLAVFDRREALGR